MRSALPFLLLAAPLAEIAVLVMVGSRIGVLATLGLVVLTAVAGIILLRVQGFGALRRIRAELDAGRIPGRELVHGVMIVIAGICLVTPGLIADTIGLLLFVPRLRDAIWSFLRKRITVVVAETPRRHSERNGPQTIDLDESDFRRDPEPDRRRLGEGS